MYFRHSTRREAERLGVRGIARNLPDGTVEVIAYGTPEAVENLRGWLRRGPSGAQVAAIQEFELPSTGQLGEDQDGLWAQSFRVE